MSEKTWPETLCAAEHENWSRPWLAKPMQVDDWKVCTDAKLFVAVKGDGGEPAGDNNLDVLRDYLSLEIVDGVTFDMDALREWCGPAESSGDECACPECGRVHDRLIDRYVIDRRGILFGVPFSKRLLAATLGGAPGDTVTIGRPKEGFEPFPIIGEGWRGALMPLRMDENEDYDPLDDLALETAS